mmetsp:Transcript_15227/g.42104  ORF Transcript_15227/g.42104 Transcript_15227/m.42104 type:complete len:234 (-) Transcript_15227:220-921(-)
MAPRWTALRVLELVLVLCHTLQKNFISSHFAGLLGDVASLDLPSSERVQTSAVTKFSTAAYSHTFKALAQSIVWAHNSTAWQQQQRWSMESLEMCTGSCSTRIISLLRVSNDSRLQTMLHGNVRVGRVLDGVVRPGVFLSPIRSRNRKYVHTAIHALPRPQFSLGDVTHAQRRVTLCSARCAPLSFGLGLCCGLPKDHDDGMECLELLPSDRNGFSGVTSSCCFHFGEIVIMV